MQLGRNPQHRDAWHFTLLVKAAIREVGQDNKLVFPCPEVGQHSQASFRPQGTKQVPQASEVQIVNHTKGDAGYTCR